MFFQGRVYNVRLASPTLRSAVREFIARRCTGIDDPLEQFEAAEEALESIELARFLAKHLVPELREPITEANRAEVLKWIGMKHQDGTREMALTIKRSRAEADHGND